VCAVAGGFEHMRAHPERAVELRAHIALWVPRLVRLALVVFRAPRLLGAGVVERDHERLRATARGHSRSHSATSVPSRLAFSSHNPSAPPHPITQEALLAKHAQLWARLGELLDAPRATYTNWDTSACFSVF
jgi:hypothetical protein